ncbi:signal recognition particle-docking protein FtsY [Levilactobacillus zymae]|uniref:signal recognition particle-docking protein FtsY n=1 Tax=Levilactobacillus zymae TaxID=267363 RepID=UPI0028B74493|nr:signal recognition particle-docking protein FtsY [Levilactobacillus zymae]MDT6980784.1 signal recognition particle-docking protein FtsY [Levilactobacillus zymae]
MGLFDIFRRRAKHPASETPTSETVTSETSTSSESVSVSAAETSTSETQATAAVTSATPASLTSVASESTISVSAASEDSETSVSAATATPSLTSTVTASAQPTSVTSVASTATSTVSTSSASASDAASLTTTSAAAVSAVTPSLVSATSSTSTASLSTSTTPAEPTATSDAQPASDEQLYDQGLAKTRHTFGERLNALLANFRHVDESFFDDLEETLIGADVGFDMAVKLSDELRDEVKLQNAKKSADVQNVIVEKMVEIYDQAGSQEESNALNFAKEGPTVILFVGVNGVGKTTTIGKMANRYHQAGKKVLLAAADTFRAGATEQLDVWAKRADVDIVTGKPQSDPAAVVFDAVQKAKRDDYDILFVDTAGRLQNKVNLMNELAKMKRIITREIPTAPHEVLLVLDATTGQNALTQAKLFKESTDVTGIVLTKLDGTARGGIVLAIRNELHVPVKFIGLGEQIGDLRPFDPNEFVYGLFKGLIDVSALDKAK